MSSNYNSRSRPAEICILDNKLFKIREPETINDLLSGQIDIFNKNDLTSILDYYKERGYRDARVVMDSVIIDKSNIDLNITLNEGNRYYLSLIHI